jgi:hypothetical protein
MELPNDIASCPRSREAFSNITSPSARTSWRKAFALILSH